MAHPGTLPSAFCSYVQMIRTVLLGQTTVIAIIRLSTTTNDN